MNNQFVIKSFASILILTALSSKASALFQGGVHGGGGITFTCPDRSPGREGTTANYLADTYKILIEDRQNTKLSQVGTEQQIMQAILDNLDQVDSKLSTQIKNNLSDLKFQMQPTSLRLLGDDDIQTIPEGCKKTQLAIQDLDASIVYVDEKKFLSLSNFEKAFFKLHEAYVKYYKANISTVRDHVAQMASSDQFYSVFTKAAVIKDIQRIFDTHIKTPFIGEEYKIDGTLTDGSYTIIKNSSTFIGPIYVESFDYGHTLQVRLNEQGQVCAQYYTITLATEKFPEICKGQNGSAEFNDQVSSHNSVLTYSGKIKISKTGRSIDALKLADIVSEKNPNLLLSSRYSYPGSYMYTSADYQMDLATAKFPKRSAWITKKDNHVYLNISITDPLQSLAFIKVTTTPIYGHMIAYEAQVEMTQDGQSILIDSAKINILKVAYSRPSYVLSPGNFMYP